MDNTKMVHRKQAVKLADAINAIEGAPVSEYAKALSAQWVNDEISGEEMKVRLLEYHRRLAEAENIRLMKRNLLI